MINAAGLNADRIASMLLPPNDARDFKIYPCRGQYYSYAARSPVSRLIYPIPEKNLAGLGIHATLDLNGRLRFGPDIEYTNDRSDYTVRHSNLAAVRKSIEKLIPSIRTDLIEPDYVGIRPKLSALGEPFRDFVIRSERARGFPGFINLIGIESPGLTASPAIAEMVTSLATES